TPTDAIALDSARREWEWIEIATRAGGNLQARWEMMMASLQGGLIFQKGLGAVHAMSHPLGGLTQPILHHGTLNAVILPVVLRFNQPAVTEKYATLKAAFGLPSDLDLADAVQEKSARLKLPAGLREMGVPADVLPTMIKGALLDHCNATNPRPASAEQYATLFEAA